LGRELGPQLTQSGEGRGLPGTKLMQSINYTFQIIFTTEYDITINELKIK